LRAHVEEMTFILGVQGTRPQHFKLVSSISSSTCMAFQYSAWKGPQKADSNDGLSLLYLDFDVFIASK
jgi:hypothetical protein